MPDSPGMLMSRNTASMVCWLSSRSAEGGVGRGVHLADVGVPAQQVGQLVECGCLVVDGEHGQVGSSP